MQASSSSCSASGTCWRASPRRAGHVHAHSGFLAAPMVLCFVKGRLSLLSPDRALSAPHQRRSPDYSATCDGGAATAEGPRCPLQVGARELDLELGEVEAVCEAEEQEEEASPREQV